MPDLLLTFSNPNVMTECAFHSCVRRVLSVMWSVRYLDKRVQGSNDGCAKRRCRLSPLMANSCLRNINMHYRMVRWLETCQYHSLLNQASPWGSLEVRLCRRSCRATSFSRPPLGNFTVTFSSRTMKIMENVRIELYLGEGATGAQCTISSAGSGVGSVGGIEGSWTFDPRRLVRVSVSRSGRRFRSLDFQDTLLGNSKYALVW